jgi:hypothetical protein
LSIGSSWANQRAVGGQSKEARLRVAWLNEIGDRSNFDVPKAQSPEGNRSLGVFVESSGQTQRRGEGHSEGSDT